MIGARSRIFLLLVVSLISFIVEAEEELVLRYDPSGSNSWVPYYIQGAENPGILGEYVPHLLAEAGIAGKKVVLPAARMQLALEKGEIDFDIISPSWLSEGEQSKVIFSKPFLKVTEYIVTLDQLNSPTIIDSTLLPKQQVKSYQGKVVGTVRGYYYHDDDTFTRMDFSSERELLLALASGRVKMAIIGEKTAKYWASKLGIAIDFPILHSSGELHLRLNKEHQPILNMLNEAIDALSEKGLIEQLSKKYEGDRQGAY